MRDTDTKQLDVSRRQAAKWARDAARDERGANAQMQANLALIAQYYSTGKIGNRATRRHQAKLARSPRASGAAARLLTSSARARSSQPLTWAPTASYLRAARKGDGDVVVADR